MSYDGRHCEERNYQTDDDWDEDYSKKRREQRHVHEFEGSTKLAELEEDPHNHRFAGVSGEAIGVPGGHIHRVFTRTDFFEEHFHFVIRFTGKQIPVGNGKHVHFVRGMTTLNDGHRHQFQFATLIEDPISPTPEEDY